MFFHDDERQSGNIVCYQRVQKFKYDEFRRAQLNKALNFNRLKSRVVKYFGMLFFETISDQEMIDTIGTYMMPK